MFLGFISISRSVGVTGYDVASVLGEGYGINPIIPAAAKGAVPENASSLVDSNDPVVVSEMVIIIVVFILKI